MINNPSLGEMNTLGDNRSYKAGKQLLFTGDNIAEYKVIKHLGSGGMGQVYLVENIHMHKQYALKVLPPALSQNSNFIDRFKIEARVMADLKHPNIVNVQNIGYDELNRLYYIVMQYISSVKSEEGIDKSGKLGVLNTDLGSRVSDLEELLKEKKFLNEEEVLKITRQLCSALYYAHNFRGKGIVHRDLKPSNILLDGDGNAYITDFGLVKVIGLDSLKSIGNMNTILESGDSSSQTEGSSNSTSNTQNSTSKNTDGSIIGTYEYMSPEQQEGRDVTVQSDIYSLGLIIYRMLTGEKARGRWKFPSEIGLSVIWDDVVIKCLEHESEDRFSSALDIINILKEEEDCKKYERNNRSVKFYFSWSIAVCFILIFLYLFINILRSPDTTLNIKQLRSNDIISNSTQSSSIREKDNKVEGDKKIVVENKEDVPSLNKSKPPVPEKTAVKAEKKSTPTVRTVKVKKKSTEAMDVSKINRRTVNNTKTEDDYKADLKQAIADMHSSFMKNDYKNAKIYAQRVNSMNQYNSEAKTILRKIKENSESVKIQPVLNRALDAKKKLDDYKFAYGFTPDQEKIKSQVEEKYSEACHLFKLKQFSKALHEFEDVIEGCENIIKMEKKKVAPVALAEENNIIDMNDIDIGLSFSPEEELNAYEWYLKAAEKGNPDAMYKLAELSKDDKVEAFKWYESSAEKGNSDAMYKLAGMYKEGIGIYKDSEKAFEWYLQSAEKGNSDAMYDLGNMYRSGTGTEQDHRKAFDCYSSSAEKGNIYAMTSLGNMYLGGNSVLEKNFEKSVEWYNKAALGGDPVAMFNLGCLFQSLNTQKEYKKALKWYKLAADKGDGSAMYNLACMHREGLGTVQSNKEAFYFYMMSAAEGNIYAMYNLGKMYQEGVGTDHNDSLAFKWYMKAAEGGNSDAMNEIGWLYFEGKGIELNTDASTKWFRKSAALGNPDAMYFLGILHNRQQEFSSARWWFLKSAAKGNFEAMYILGIMYEKGEGVSEDNKKALKWYMRSAEKGNPDAMYKLGCLYMNGKGTTKDYAVAVEWFLKSAVKGNSDAMAKLDYMYRNLFKGSGRYGEIFESYRKSAREGNNVAMTVLGAMYSEGLGVPENYNKAFSWYHKAALMGNSVAMYYLGNMYRDGKGTEQNYLIALEWYKKSAEKGNTDAMYYMGNLRSDEIASNNINVL